MPRKKTAAPTPPATPDDLAPEPLPAPEPAAPVPPLAAARLAFLAEEGYRPTYDPGGERWGVVRFKAEGTRFALWVDEDDEAYFRLVSSWQLDEGVDLPAAFARANDVNDHLKVVKVSISPGQRCVQFSVECLLDGPPSTRLLERALDVVRTAAREYHEPVRPPDRLDA